MALALAPLREATRLTQLDLRMEARMCDTVCAYLQGLSTLQHCIMCTLRNPKVSYAQHCLAGLFAKT